VYKLHYRPAFAWWVLGVSVVGGFLLLYVLVILLWKVTFLLSLILALNILMFKKNTYVLTANQKVWGSIPTRAKAK
jgi:hypothetical protein